jgi:hypothetical protein
MLSPAKEKMIKKRVILFAWAPFVRLAVLSGSCAIGSAREDSDIDIVIGTDNKRVYLCRAMTILFLDILKVRNKGNNELAPSSPSVTKADLSSLRRVERGESPKKVIEADKLCLSHFTSISSLKMNEPENSYERESYPKLAPVYGEPSICAAFIKSNIRIIGRGMEYRSSYLYVGSKKKWPARFIEKILSGKLGDKLEKWARLLQSKKISNYASNLAKDGRKMRIITSKDRIETYYKIQ